MTKPDRKQCMLLSMSDALERIPDSQRKVLGDIWDKATALTEDEINCPKNNKPIYIAPPTARLKNEIRKFFGKNIKLEKQSISFERVYHISDGHGEYKEHAPEQIPVTKERFILMADVLENFDAVEKRVNNSVRISKRYSDGEVVVADAILRNGNLAIKTMWIKKPDRHQLP